MGAFTGKVVIVTGASSGIGRALALLLAEQRARLVLAARDEARLREVAAACEAKGADALVVPTDVAAPEACRRLVERSLERYKILDVLVNNAGVGMIARFDEVQDLSGYESVMRVNYLGSVHLTHHALPALKASRGLIVAVASLTGLTGVPLRTAYAASKHAMVGFFESLRIELRGTGVDVTIVAPDFVLTEIQRRAAGPDGRPLGKSQLDASKVMSAEQCARLIVAAMERRRRLLITSLRGRLGRWARLVAPGLVDRIALRAVAKGPVGVAS
jgi:short-subunit dehydrogenase